MVIRVSIDDNFDLLTKSLGLRTNLLVSFVSYTSVHYTSVKIRNFSETTTPSNVVDLRASNFHGVEVVDRSGPIVRV